MPKGLSSSGDGTNNMSSDKNMEWFLDKYCTPQNIEEYEDFLRSVEKASPAKSVQMIRAWNELNYESFNVPVRNN
jgi:hypothetical protein